MTISEDQKNLFTSNPRDYILRIDENNSLYAEKKGIWT
jgi:hypothetical protein